MSRPFIAILVVIAAMWVWHAPWNPSSSELPGRSRSDLLNRPIQGHPKEQRDMINFKKYLSNVDLPSYDASDVLELMGLQKKSNTDWIIPLIAGAGCGIVVGAGIAFFLTPYKGSEVREKVAKGANEAKGYLESKANELSEKVLGSDTTGTIAQATVPRPTTQNRGY